MKKIISLVLAVLLCLGAFPLTVLAEPAEDPINYVALSDSMGQGYMFLDYNENAAEGHYCGWEGTSERSYIKKFARDLENDFGAVNFTDLTIQGLQPDEVCAFLEPETFDFDSMTRGARKHIGWWTKEFVTDEEQDPNTFLFETFKDMSDYYIDAIKNADVITYDIGMNYFGTFLTDTHGDNENYMDLMENKAFAVLIEIARRLLLNELGSSAEAEELTGRILYSYMSYLLYTEKCIGAIYKLNPDVKLILIPLANPHRELYVTVDGSTVGYSDLIDMMLDTLNDYIRNSGWYSKKYYFADLSGPVISFTDELYYYPNSLSEDVKVLLGQAVMGYSSILGTNNYPTFPAFAELYEGAVQSGIPENIAYFQYMLYFAVDEYGEALVDEDGNYLMSWNVLDRLIYDYISEQYGENVAYNDFFGNYIDLILGGPTVPPTPSVTGDNIQYLGYPDININPVMIDRARAAITAGTAEDWQKHVVEAADLYVGDWEALCLKAATKRVFPIEFLTGNFDVSGLFTTEDVVRLLKDPDSATDEELLLLHAGIRHGQAARGFGAHPCPRGLDVKYKATARIYKNRIRNDMDGVCNTLTVHYIYADGTEALEDYIAKVKVGEDYNVITPEIEGYMPDRGAVAGTMEKKNIEVTVTYIAKTLGECVAMEEVSLSAGKHHLYINDKDMGEYTFAKSGSGWTIKGENGYLVVSNGKLTTSTRSTTTWTYSNNGFRCSVRGGFLNLFSTTYYLAAGSNGPVASTSSRNTVTKFYDGVSGTGEHQPAEAVKENVIAATCKAEGGYDLVVYCSVCGKQLSRNHVVEEKLTEHTPGTPVEENVVAASCTEPGSYDEVTYCTVCGEELSRDAKNIEATGHTHGTPVHENVNDATCTEPGSYDEVTYCTVCGDEVERHDDCVIEAKGHTPGKAKRETIEGTDYMVTRCTVCGEILEKTEAPADVITANVTVTSKTSGFWIFRTTTYTAKILAMSDDPSVTVKTVQYSTNNRTWRTGTSYQSSSRISTLYVRVTDSTGAVTNFVYKNGTVTKL